LSQYERELFKSREEARIQEEKEEEERLARQAQREKEE